VTKRKNSGGCVLLTSVARAKLNALARRSGRGEVELASMAVILLDSVSRHLRLLGGHQNEEPKR
jgi:hypothetical protein